MEKFDRNTHWDNIYNTKLFETVSWYQKIPKTSLSIIKENANKEAAIIDVGGGDNYLVDFLCKEGYENISVLDISQKALLRAQQRLSDKAQSVTWINADIVNFNAKEKYDFWHDRAVFHFLTQPDEINNYVKTVSNSVLSGGYFLLGTFSTDGPTKCSGIEVTQYDEPAMCKLFEKYFETIKCFREDHQTPTGKIQNFQFCLFRRK